MKVSTFLLATAALNAVAAGLSVANAGETKVERERTCVCSWNLADAPVPPAPPPGAPQVHVFRHGGGDEDRIVIYRTLRDHQDSADANGDGKVTRREFMNRAEKHFKERDKNNDGTLNESETAPMPFTVPMPPEPPMPPLPPAPPVPPED